MTGFPDHISEAALGNKARAAYARSDLFEKRRQLMDAWAKYCEATEIPKQPASPRAKVTAV
jgi:hypothetical protein